MDDGLNTSIQALGSPKYTSPFLEGEKQGRGRFIPDSEKIRFRVEIEDRNLDKDNVFFEKAGPREKIYFDPTKTRAAIVTCGGLCPGLNNVIRSIVMELSENYGINKIVGFQYGFLGLRPDAKVAPRILTPSDVHNIHLLGGSILGSSRGPVEPSLMVDTLVSQRIDLLFCLGGDGTMRGAHAIAEEVAKRDLKIGIIGIPKTIDNDVPFVWRTFGFATAIEKARDVVLGAATEVHSYLNTVAIVKLMGRDAGFISAMTTLAAQDVDFTLIPEISFHLDGGNGFLNALEAKVKLKGGAVVVVSEGAGQDLFKDASTQFDASGNRLQHDIGLLLKEKVPDYFKKKGIALNLRYFDPTYSIRAVPANCDDAMLCDQFARAAVHAGMAGKTDLLVGQWYNNLTYVPLSLSTGQKKRISPKQETWCSVLSVTGQPASM